MAPAQSNSAQSTGVASTDSSVHPASSPEVEPVSSSELNAWRRGFTPQAEIWNGRLAMLGLSLGLAVLLISRLALR
jgi:hypothetical protein